MFKREWINIFALVLFLAFAIYFDSIAVRDPATGEIVTAYDSAGKIADTASRAFAVYMLPVAALILYTLSVFVSNASVYKIHLDRFFEKFFSFKLTFIFLMFALYASRVLVNQGRVEWEQNILVAILSAAFFYMGYVFDHLKSNYFAPWIKGRNKMWEDTHHIGTWLFYICGAFILFALVPAYKNFLIFIISVPLFCILIMIVLYSYIIFKKEHHLR
ncbi:MAG TPA: hypothetical protein VK158_04285 [Acidobacteriota bacterium]|nr:hypothetical protein [Acidobacteriota bacterium]